MRSQRSTSRRCVAATFLLTTNSIASLVQGQTTVGCDASCPSPGYEDALCPGDVVDASVASKVYDVCHPTTGGGDGSTGTVQLDAFRGNGRVTVIANYYTGCVAGRRESGVFAHVAQRWHDRHPNVNFLVSLKGGGDCAQWANVYQNDASAYGDGSKPNTMPLTISDDSYELRDYYFTSPYPHPSYVVLDENLKVLAKVVGPCCGYEDFFQCTPDVAKGLDETLSQIITDAMGGVQTGRPTRKPTTDHPTSAPQEAATTAPSVSSAPSGTPSVSSSPTETICSVGDFSSWSDCSTTCGEGMQFRWRHVQDLRVDGGSGSGGSASDAKQKPCPTPIETRTCVADVAECDEQCVPEFGRNFTIDVVSSGFSSPRDIDFHPTPGLHLGDYSEGRTFYPDSGEEAWVVNGGNHSISIVASLGHPDHQTTISRQDRGYYHYMINATAIAFNAVSNSNRSRAQDSFNYFAVCNDNRNDYLEHKEPNYFMGPTLYNSDPRNGNTVSRLGRECSPAEPCHFLHADMLHESPSCIGMTHDPETRTAYGNVYWAFDATGDLTNGQLVRFDFQQPHGPGSMDHSIAAVRRYPEVKLDRGPPGVHAGMAMHPSSRDVFVSSPGDGTVLVVGADTGSYSRTAREEYPIFSNRLPSFEYSIYECVDQRVFASGLTNPTGLALSADGERLFVAERGGSIKVFEVVSGALLHELETGFESIGGMSFSPKSQSLHFVDSASQVLAAVKSTLPCEPMPESRLSSAFVDSVAQARSALDAAHGEGYFSLDRDYACQVDATIPSGTLFEQVHVGSGYASDNPDVQSQAGMDESASLLANRTDCEPDSELNFDALLLGGYYCHRCLPQNNGSSCDSGGTCTNVQWQGFTCDNEYFVSFDSNGTSLVVSNAAGDTFTSVFLSSDVTYRFTVNTPQPVLLQSNPSLPDEVQMASSPSISATVGPILVAVDDFTPNVMYLVSPGMASIPLFVVDESEGPPTDTSSSKLMQSSTVLIPMLAVAILL